MSSDYQAWQLVRQTADIYRGRLGLRLHAWVVTVLRPWYGVFGAIFPHIPHGSKVLDIGCGGGGFLLLACRLRQLGPSVGLDVNQGSINLAVAASNDAQVEFEATSQVPENFLAAADVVTMIDVLHHVEPAERPELIQRVIAGIAPGVRLVIKDLDPKPSWRAWANRVTDYLSTRSRVSYIALDELVDLVQGAGLRVCYQQRLLKHVWSHYLLVVERPAV